MTHIQPTVDKDPSVSFIAATGNRLRKSKATVALLTALALSGCADASNENPTPVASETSTVAPDVEAPDNNETEYVGEVLQQTVTYEAMQAMSINEFAKLPYADRLAYGIETLSSLPLDTPSTQMDPTIIPALFWQHVNGIAYNNADPDVRAKSIGTYQYYTSNLATGEISPNYQEAIDVVVRDGGEGIGNNVIFKLVDSGAIQQGVDRDGNPIDFANVTYYIDLGDVNTPEITAQAIRTEVQLLDGRTVVYYAQGYIAQGRQSPDTNYPY